MSILSAMMIRSGLVLVVMDETSRSAGLVSRGTAARGEQMVVRGDRGLLVIVVRSELLRRCRRRGTSRLTGPELVLCT